MVLGLLSAAAGFAATGVLALLAPASIRSWRTPIPLLVAGFGLTGAMADPAATGIGVLDAVLRAVLCGATVLVVGGGPFPGRAGSRSSTRSPARRAANRWLVVAAAALVLAGAGPSSVWLAGAGLGLAGGAVAGRLRAPVIMALSAGLTTQAALRLGRPDAELATATLATVAFAMLIGAGVTALPRARRRQALRAGWAALGVAAACSFLGLVAAAQARPAMESGLRSATAGLAEARTGKVERSSQRLDAAARSFATAHGAVDAWWARPALAVPVLGRHSRALRAMAASGATLSESGARAAGVVDVADLRLDRGAVPLERIAALEAQARLAFSELTTAEARLQRVASPWLVPPVSGRLGELSEGVEEARSAAETAMLGAEVAPALLGADGPRRYFLAVLTPSELRGSGGLIGNFGEVSADRGRLRLDRLGRIGELVSAGKPATRQLVGAPPDYVARYAQFEVARLFQDVTLSPDFPSVARVIAGLYPQAGGRPLDGVIAIDPIGLAALLEVVGPVEVREWPVPITADNAAQVLLFDQYVRFQGDNADRVDFLGKVTQAVWQRLTTTTPSVVQLARTLGPVVAQKHFQLASTRPDEERAFSSLGAAGAMAPVTGDFLGVVTQNSANNKIDWFLRRSVNYQARIDPSSGTVRSAARIVLRNGAPASGLPAYVIGSAREPPLPPGTNRMYLSVYTPWLLNSAKADGKPLFMAPDRELDRQVYSAYVSIPPGGSLTVELELEGQLDTRHGYRLDLHRQPFLAPDDFSASVLSADGWALGRRGGSQWASEQFRLSTDRYLEVPVRPSL